MKLDIDTPLDCYSLAATARSEDSLESLIKNLDLVGSNAAFKNILYGVRIIVEGRNRRLTDFAEMVKDEDHEEEEDKIVINVYRDDLVETVVDIVRRSGFRKILRKRDSNYLIIDIPNPTENQLQEFAGETKRLERVTISTIARIKSDAVQRIKAGLEREYIEPLAAGPAKAHLEIMQRQAVRQAKLLGLKKRKSLIGNDYQYTDDDEEKLGKLLDKPIYNNFFI